MPSAIASTQDQRLRRQAARHFQNRLVKPSAAEFAVPEVTVTCDTQLPNYAEYGADLRGGPEVNKAAERCPYIRVSLYTRLAMFTYMAGPGLPINTIESSITHFKLPSLRGETGQGDAVFSDAPGMPKARLTRH